MGETRNKLNISIRKSEGKTKLGRPRSRGDSNMYTERNMIGVCGEDSCDSR
jgi:hypothetical protein